MDSLLDPGYLSDEQILCRMKDSEQQSKASASEGKIALSQRLHNLLAAEITLRAGSTGHFVTEIAEPDWPPLTESEPPPHRNAHNSRIPFPDSNQQLWSQHKYSVMARSQSLYRTIGPKLASGNMTFEGLWQLLEANRRQAPDAGGLRNAVQHMWGYIKSSSELRPDITPLPQLFREIQQQAVRQQCQYLLHSTALGEFAYWCWRLDTDNGALTSTHPTDSTC